MIGAGTTLRGSGGSFAPPTAMPSALTLIGSTGVCWILIIGGGGGAPAAGVIFGTAGAAVPLGGVGFVPGTLDAGGTGMPATGVMRRGTTPAMPPTSVPLAPGAPVGTGIPAGGVRRRGTIGGGLVDPVPISVLPELATPRGGGRDPPPMTAGGGRDPPPTGGGGRDPPLGPGRGGGPELAFAFAFASARARAASSITARAEAGNADVSVVWMSPGGAGMAELPAASAPPAAPGGALGEDADGGGGALASPPLSELLTRESIDESVFALPSRSHPGAEHFTDEIEVLEVILRPATTEPSDVQVSRVGALDQRHRAPRR